MRREGLASVRVKKRRTGLTKSARNAYIVPNLLAQDFTTTQSNQKWVMDTTYIPTKVGWLYLVTVLDLYSRMIVGWAMGQQHDAALATSALDMAIRPARPKPGIFASRQQARMALFDYIEIFYNRQRLHSGIDYACPVSRAA